MDDVRYSTVCHANSFACTHFPDPKVPISKHYWKGAKAHHTNTDDIEANIGHLVSSGGWVPDCHEGGQGFEPWPDQHIKN